MGKLVVKNRYSTTPNHLSNDINISFKAKGIWTYLQSKPENWKFSAERIVNDTCDGHSSILSGLKELERFGYLRRVKYQDKSGYWQIDYLLLESGNEPDIQKPNSDFPNGDFPDKDFPDRENMVNNSKKDNSKKDNSNRERESNASLSSPSSISPSIPLLSEDEKKEMDFLNSPKVEAKKEAVKGGEKILQTLSQAEMIFEKEIEDCQRIYFNSTNYQRAVETLCASSGLVQNKTKESAIADLKYCSVSFNEMLYSTGTTNKTMKDYASHFRNWLQKQDIQEVRERGNRIIHKIPLKENLRNGSNTGISPAVKRQMEAIFGTDPK